MMIVPVARLETIQVLRGIAAGMVVLAHTASGDNFVTVFPRLGGLASYGYLGVPIFFVVSGFVIPHMMAAMDYRIGRDAWPFLLRRLVRLEPPYVVMVLLAFAIAYAAARTPGYGGAPFSPSLEFFLSQFLYVGPWFDVPWINNVAWTLAIEFQYYILMLVAAPLLLAPSRLQQALFFAAVIALSALVEDSRAVFHYLPCFAVGFAVFLLRSKRISISGFLALFVLFVALAAYNTGVAFALAAAFAGAAILVPLRQPLPLLSRLGAISYSLYLVHLPIGGRVGNLLMRLPWSWNQTAAAGGAIATSLMAAIALWYAVEAPAHAWAKRIVVRA
jgi:peptidoglycan/LPS O-acetylase OafA/YrhL